MGFCLPVVLPFLIGLAAAQLAEPAVRALCRRLRLPRWAAAALCLSALLALLSLGLWLLGRIVCGELSGFADSGNVSSWAKDALQWTVAEGIINGSDGKLLPQGNATRAQVSAILMRFIENIVKA